MTEPTRSAAPSEDARVACLRCGTFVGRDDTPLVGVALCRACLTGDRKGPDPVNNWAPRFMLRRRLAILALAPVPVLGLLILADPSILGRLLRALSSGDGPWWVGVGQALGVSGGIYAGLVFLSMTWLPHGSVRWKQEMLDRLAIDRALAERFRLVIFASRPPSATNWRNPIELGLLVEGEGGLAFLGENGTRLTFPKAEVVAARIVFLYLLWPPRTALRIEVRGGARRCFAIIDRPTRRENREEARRCMTRLLERAPIFE